MGFWLLVFFLTPIAEMYLLIEVGGYIGTLPTILLVMATAVIGVALLRVQGLATLTRGIGRLQRGEVPVREMAEGILLAVAGALLITPGFFTDVVGFVLLFPPSRSALARQMLSRVTLVGHSSAPRSGESRGSEAGFRNNPSGDIYDGEFERRNNDDEKPPAA